MYRDDILAENTYNRVKLVRRRLPYRGSIPAYKLSASLKELKKDLGNLFTGFNDTSTDMGGYFSDIITEVETALARLNALSVRTDNILRSIDYV